MMRVMTLLAPIGLLPLHLFFSYLLIGNMTWRKVFLLVRNGCCRCVEDFGLVGEEFYVPTIFVWLGKVLTLESVWTRVFPHCKVSFAFLRQSVDSVVLNKRAKQVVWADVREAVKVNGVGLYILKILTTMAKITPPSRSSAVYYSWEIVSCHRPAATSAAA